MPKYAFKLRIKADAIEEYDREHQRVWPELLAKLKDVGISDYSIFLDEATGALFAVQRLAEGERSAELPQHPVMRRWWTYMADLMQTNPDGSPLVTPLTRVFRLD